MKYMDQQEKDQKQIKIKKIIIIYLNGILNFLPKMIYIVIYGILPYGNSKAISN